MFSLKNENPHTKVWLPCESFLQISANSSLPQQLQIFLKHFPFSSFFVVARSDLWCVTLRHSSVCPSAHGQPPPKNMISGQFIHFFLQKSFFPFNFFGLILFVHFETFHVILSTHMYFFRCCTNLFSTPKNSVPSTPGHFSLLVRSSKVPHKCYQAF